MQEAERLNALLGVVRPAWAISVLQAALAALTQETDTHTRLPTLAPAVVAAPEPAGDTCPQLAAKATAPPAAYRIRPARAAKSAGSPEWATLRDEVSAAAAARGINRRELAKQAGLNFGSVKTCMAPSGNPPGPAIAAKLRRWLDRLPPPAPVLDEIPEAAGNGVGTFPSTHGNGAGDGAAA
jgi:hypothetical protein